ncbi:Aste57867_22093 [Aphanomyces stellatus]|uniref:Aste57867_22093 protein n=1 Tax=Aphanomyces stellatus TaxID=120398 RepID=A0A485LK34_9STRA|nr:hypothetical protein As57867_022024 [Aphanomyces stellatus]VFT98761.1 Aste57867_22093 [Aphanomyces stellatus]
MWSDKILTPLVTNPTRNPYDVREICDPTCNDYGMAKTGVYLNQSHVQAMLGVHKPYAWNNATVGMAFAFDAGKSVALLEPEILAAGVRVLLNVHGTCALTTLATPRNSRGRDAHEYESR